MIPVAEQINIEGAIRDDAVGFGIRASLGMLTGGRIERHLSQPELTAVIALAYETGARSAMIKVRGVA
jgi:hypothetical protein